MAQFKFYGHRDFLEASAPVISSAVHRASVHALGLPESKRFHRFIPLESWQFVHPEDRSPRYIIIEVLMFTGRPVETRKAFLSAVLRNLQDACDLAPADIEVTIIESPRHNWLICGVPGDELELTYNVAHVAGQQP